MGLVVNGVYFALRVIDYFVFELLFVVEFNCCFLMVWRLVLLCYVWVCAWYCLVCCIICWLFAWWFNSVTWLLMYLVLYLLYFCLLVWLVWLLLWSGKWFVSFRLLIVLYLCWTCVFLCFGRDCLLNLLADVWLLLLVLVGLVFDWLDLFVLGWIIGIARCLLYCDFCFCWLTDCLVVYCLIVL